MPKNKEIVRSIRLNLNHPDDARIWEALQAQKAKGIPFQQVMKEAVLAMLDHYPHRYDVTPATHFEAHVRDMLQALMDKVGTIKAGGYAMTPTQEEQVSDMAVSLKNLIGSFEDEEGENW